jgi:hypothetical protein
MTSFIIFSNKNGLTTQLSFYLFISSFIQRFMIWYHYRVCLSLSYQSIIMSTEIDNDMVCTTILHKHNITPAYQFSDLILEIFIIFN